MATAKEKFLELLKLLNNVRINFHGLCGLVESDAKNAEDCCTQAGELYEKALGCRDEVSMTGKVTAAIRKVLEQLSKDIEYLKESFGVNMKASMKLYAEYTSDAEQCCNMYKILKAKNGVDPATEKGYRQQVKLIQKIRDMIKTLIKRFNLKKEEFSEYIENITKNLNGMTIIGAVQAG